MHTDLLELLVFWITTSNKQFGNLEKVKHKNQDQKKKNCLIFYDYLTIPK